MTSEKRSDMNSVDIGARNQAVVLGDGPRIEPLDVKELSDDLWNILTRMAQVNSAIQARGKDSLAIQMAELVENKSTIDESELIANLSEIMLTMLRHPNLFACQADIGIQLLGSGALSGRDRELAVLRVGWLCHAPYEWGEHVHVAKAVGITSEEIERITHGPDAPGWSEQEQAILRAVDELHDKAMISDATWATLSRHFNDKQLIELPILIGQYHTVAYYQNSLRLRLHEGNLGLKAR